MTTAVSMILVGCGAMGGALLRGWLAAPGLLERVTVVTPDFPTVEPFMNQDPRVHWVKEPSMTLPDFDVLVLAVKPQVMPSVLAVYRDLITPTHCVLSIAAGLDLAFYEGILGADKQIVRIMPNTPATIAQAMCGLLPNTRVSLKNRRHVESLAKAVGKSIWIDNDDDLDRLTAISGCGPAYVFALVEALEAAARQLGFLPEDAALLARQTVVGSAAYLAAAKDKSPTDLRVQVTSPGGMTAAGLEVLQGEGALATLIQGTTKAAYERAHALKKEAS